MGKAILIPDLILYEALNNMINIIREDYSTKPNKKQTYLWYTFGEDEDNRPLQIGKMNLFDQAVDIFINGGNDEKKRKVEVSLGYNMKRLGMPNINIMMPSENPKNAGVGDNEGYEDHEIDNAKNVSYRIVTQDCSVVYNLLVSSDNVNEVLIIYNFLKASFLSFKPYLALKGLQNVMSGGSDLSLGDDLMPTNIFHRNFNVAFDYDYSAIDLCGEGFGTNFKLTGTPTETPVTTAQL